MATVVHLGTVILHGDNWEKASVHYSVEDTETQMFTPKTKNYTVYDTTKTVPQLKTIVQADIESDEGV